MTSNGKEPALSDGVPQINWPPTNQEMKGREGPRNSELRSSRAFSVATPAADKSRRDPLRAENPGSIPTAGGQALGQRATAEREYRRKSMMSLDSGKGLVLDRQGSPDATTQNNTQANIVPQRMQQDNGEGSSKVEPPLPDLGREKSGSAPPDQMKDIDAAIKQNENPVANDIAPDEVGPNEETPAQAVPSAASPAAAAPNTTVPAETAQTNTAPAEMAQNKASSAETAPKEAPKNDAAHAAASKERRGSRLDGLLGKLGLGNKKT